MAKAVRGRPRKKMARKAPLPVKRKVAPALSTSSDKFRTLVSSLTTAELDELIRVASGRKNEELASAKASFLDEVRAKAASLGMSLAELVSLGAGKLAPAPKGGKTQLAAKYRNPKTGETWSGRGRPARWLVELEAQGRKREELAI